MPLPTTGNLSFSAIRQEGHKTSWLSPNYPTVGTLYQTGRDFLIQADENNQLGSNPDTGEFDFKQCYGWDTWKRPTLEWVSGFQYDVDQGLIVGFRVSGGDVFRTIYNVALYTGGYSGSVYATQNFRFAPEFEGSGYGSTHEADNKKYSNADELFQATNGTWYFIESVGGLGEWQNYLNYPTQADLVVPNGTQYPDIECIACFPNVPAGVYYPQVRMGDGRISDTLPATPSPSAYTVNSPNPVWMGWTQASYENGPELNDADNNGNGSVEVFSEIGTPTEGTHTESSLRVDITNAYTYFFNRTLKFWVFFYEGTGDQLVQTPKGYVLPRDEPSSYSDGSDDDYLYPYEGLHDLSEPFSDDYNTFEEYRWVLVQGDPLAIAGLAANTGYTVLVTTYKESDMHRDIDNAVSAKTASAPDIHNDNRTVYDLGILTTAMGSGSEPTCTIDDGFNSFSYDEPTTTFYFEVYTASGYNQNFDIALEYSSDAENWSTVNSEDETTVTNEGTTGDYTEYSFFFPPTNSGYYRLVDTTGTTLRTSCDRSNVLYITTDETGPVVN